MCSQYRSLLAWRSTPCLLLPSRLHPQSGPCLTQNQCLQACLSFSLSGLVLPLQCTTLPTSWLLTALLPCSRNMQSPPLLLLLSTQFWQQCFTILRKSLGWSVCCHQQ